MVIVAMARDVIKDMAWVAIQRYQKQRSVHERHSTAQDFKEHLINELLLRMATKQHSTRFRQQMTTCLSNGSGAMSGSWPEEG